MLCSGCVVGVVMFSRVSVYCVSVLKGVWVGVLVSVFVLSAKEERHLTLTRNRKSLHVVSSILSDHMFATLDMK